MPLDLIWQIRREKYINKNQLETFIKKYSENSRPKIGWEKEKNINHFKLVGKIYKNEFGITKEEINDLFLPANFEKLINEDFVNLLNRERREVIVECLKFRYNRLMKILES